MNKIYTAIDKIINLPPLKWFNSKPDSFRTILENAIWFLLALSIVGVLFGFTNNTLIGSGFVKQSILIVGTNLALLSWLILQLYNRTSKINWKISHSLAFLFLVIIGFSTFFSQYVWGSLVGTTVTTVNALSVWSLFVLFFLLSQRSVDELGRWVKLILVSVGILVIFSFMQFFGWYAFPNPVTHIAAFTPFGTIRAFGLLLVIILPLIFAIPNESTSNFAKFFSFISVLIIAVFLQPILSTLVWWLFVATVVISLILNYLSAQKGNQWLSLVLLAFGLVMAIWPVRSIIGVSLPANVRMTNVLSYTLATDNLTTDLKQFSVGNGPSTFAQVFMQKRPVQLNDAVLVRGEQNVELWGVRFVQPSNVVSLLLVTTGVLGLLSFAILLIWNLFLAWQTSLTGSENLLYRGLTASLSIFALAMFVQSFSLPLFVVLFALLGLLAMGKSSKEYEINYTSIRTLLIIVLMVLAFVVSVVVIKWQTERMLASHFATRSIESRAGGYYEQAVNEAGKAVRLVPKDDVYTRLLVENWLNYAIDLSNQEQIDQQKLQTAVLAAIQVSAQAERLDPKNGRNVAQLAFVFRQVAPFFDGAANLSVETYNRAEDVEPTNPALPTEKARSLIVAAQYAERNIGVENPTESDLEQFRSSKINEAEQALNEAIALKSDYAPARFLLANLAIQQNRVGVAVQELNELQSSNPRDAGLHYQRGILLYSQADYANAKNAFESAVNVNENFANARYFLGLSLSELGETEKAIAQFETIKKIDPKSSEAIDQILLNLRAGRDALTNVNSEPVENLDEPINTEEVNN